MSEGLSYPLSILVKWNKVYQTELILNSNFFQKLIIQNQFCLANSLRLQHSKLQVW